MAHEVTIKTPLGDEELLLRQMTGTEGLSKLFVYNVTLYSPNEQIKVDSILGQNVTINLATKSGERHFNGYVTQFEQVERITSGLTVYHARVSPWLWFLTRTSDCRIFQEMTVLEIVQEVLKDHGYSGDVKDLTTGTFPIRDYCVQYRETDFNFVCRLLEQEGIYFYFEHEKSSHQLVLADGYSSHTSIKGESTLPYHLSGLSQTIDEEHVSGWVINSEIQPNSVSLKDFNFETPKKKLTAMRMVKRNHAKAGADVFDYPGEYLDDASGEQYALKRIEELQASFEDVTADSDARAINTGNLFELGGHPRDDQNREYLVLSACYELNASEYFSGSGDESPIFRCSFKAISSKTPFRAPRATPKPIVQGPQTAIVVGKAGQEIDPDKYGRVKVQFHWDRYGKSDDKSSCWIRVAQSWAGARWGAQFIPRIGHEVLVEFLEGDPDRPLITGSIYNADNMPPYTLPDDKTHSGIKSRSSKDGTDRNFNEIRMEDNKGNELLFIQAEKDQQINIKNDKEETVGNDETVSIGNDRKVTVGRDENLLVKNNQELNVEKERTTTIGNKDTLEVGQVLKISAGDEIEIKTGQAKISMKKDGNIKITGMTITIEDSGGGKVEVGPGGMITIKGSMVKIN